MEIVRPTLILDKEVCLNNIKRMAAKASSKNVFFRPHFKTHQSAEIGAWFRSFGVQAITVSSVEMAEYFADQGWDDITIAIPINIYEINQINTLAQKIKLNLLIENKDMLIQVDKFIKSPVGMFIEIDTGHNRTGIMASKTNQIDALIQIISKNENLNFKGFLTHGGHTYKTKSKYEIFNLHFDALLKMRSLKNRYRKDYPDLMVSLGDTPSASICDNFDGVDELRPGNFVFYDLMQYKLGSCYFNDIAIRLVCPVIAKHGSRNEITIYGGAIHISKDSIINIDGKNLYGQIVIRKGNEKILLSEKNYLWDMSQEHGILKMTYKDFDLIKVGDLVEIIPVHSCLTANLMGKYITTEGEEITTIQQRLL
ncbi:alanine racemase [Sunxiuqinia indica]|uniref:alanine racemase n=1 Tax=Sunxiuqinia indica TaxID=2692584 RepID=UPI001356976B|nr:alanine racemase [Sunxiuqinia indica]